MNEFVSNWTIESFIIFFGDHLFAKFIIYKFINLERDKASELYFFHKFYLANRNIELDQGPSRENIPYFGFRL